ncbi:hypothetical protein VTK56DRAFT_8449 [Thermocarpiscus australiensis]
MAASALSVCLRRKAFSVFHDSISITQEHDTRLQQSLLLDQQNLKREKCSHLGACSRTAAADVPSTLTVAQQGLTFVCFRWDDPDNQLQDVLVCCLLARLESKPASYPLMLDASSHMDLRGDSKQYQQLVSASAKRVSPPPTYLGPYWLVESTACIGERGRGLELPPSKPLSHGAAGGTVGTGLPRLLPGYSNLEIWADWVSHILP